MIELCHSKFENPKGCWRIGEQLVYFSGKRRKWKFLKTWMEGDGTLARFIFIGWKKLKIYFEVEKVVIFTVRKYWLPEFIV